MDEPMSTPRPGPKRLATSIRLRPDIVLRAKELARDYAGKPLYLTLSAIVEAGLERECSRIERLMHEDAQDDEKGTGAIRRVQVPVPRHINNATRADRRGS